MNLSVVVLVYNRRAALHRTLSELEAHPIILGAQIIVVDNGSSDGSSDMARTDFPRVTTVRLEQNLGVEGFNAGVRKALGELVLILDDDSWPDAASLESAVQALERDDQLGAATLVPRHPETRASEWPAAERLSGPVDDWPIMGCGNLVRRDVWNRLGGYESAFFLYRNDWDLALKVLNAGMGVRCDPAWTVWHDSPATRTKSATWCRLGVRNWCWLARRHGRGLPRITGPLLAWLNAHRRAGWSGSAHLAAIRGLAEGVLVKPPPMVAGLRPDGSHFARLVRLKLTEHRRGPRNDS